MRAQTQLKSFVSNVNVLCEEGFIVNTETPVLGKNLKNNREIMKLYTRLSLMNSSELEAMGPEFKAKPAVQRLYIFVVLFHTTFNACSKKVNSDFEQRIECYAKALSITKSDIALVTEFFLNTEAYSDKRLAVYFNNDKPAGNVKYIGTNIKYAAKRHKEIVYLKYLKNYNLFLSKTFIKNDNPYYTFENLKVSEIDVLNESNYFMDDFGYLSYEEVLDSVKRHHPFQYFELAATSNTPKIILDPEESKMVISGSSSPFSPTNFFEPILEWLDNYGVKGKGHLKIFFMLDYFNTYTSKFLLRLTRKCEMLEKEGKSIKIYWYFDPEDDDLREFGEHLGGIYKKGFEFCSITDGKEDLI